MSLSSILVYSANEATPIGGSAGYKATITTISGTNDYNVITFFILCYPNFKALSRRVANDIAKFDKSKYYLEVDSAKKGIPLRFHLGEPIQLNWKASKSHSRKDWVGIYRVSFRLTFAVDVHLHSY